MTIKKESFITKEILQNSERRVTRLRGESVNHSWGSCPPLLGHEIHLSLPTINPGVPHGRKNAHQEETAFPGNMCLSSSYNILA